jgi:hypothetical protein
VHGRSKIEKSELTLSVGFIPLTTTFIKTQMLCDSDKSRIGCYDEIGDRIGQPKMRFGFLFLL